MEALDALVEQAERGEAIGAADLGAFLLALGAAAFDARGSGAAGASLANTLREAGERLATQRPVPAEVPVPANVAEVAPTPPERTTTKTTRPAKAATKKRR